MPSFFFDDRLHDDLIRIETQLKSQADALESLSNLLKNVFSRPPNPGAMKRALVREENDMLVYEITLPEWPQKDGANDPEVVKAVANVNIAGIGTNQDIEPGTATIEVSAQEGNSVMVTLSYVDNNGNTSAVPSTLNFSASDTIPPPNPGEMTFTLKSET